MGYTIKQKIDICLKAEANPQMTQADLAEWAKEQYQSQNKPSQTTISRILSFKNDLIATQETDFQLVRRRKQSNPILRKILTEWVTQAIWENLPITTPIIQSTANSIWTRLPNEYKVGNGIFNQKWCKHFLNKLNINLTGDDEDIQQNPFGHKLNRVWNLDEKVELKRYLHELIRTEQYRPQDVFTIDEFQLFYSLPLDQIFDINSIDKGLKQSNSSTENSLSILLGTNIDGSEKLTPLIVGKNDMFDVSFSSFKSLKHYHITNVQALSNKLTELYHIFYKNNINKWITSAMFQHYLLTLDHKLASGSPNRKILILLDDSSSHRILNLKFQNIRLCYLKNNTNHKSPYNSLYNGVNFDYLPMSFGIVHEFKVLYRLQQYLEMINLQRMFSNGAAKDTIESAEHLNLVKMDQTENNESPSDALSESDYIVPLISAIEWIKRSWDSVSQEKILSSWKRTHLINFPEVWPEIQANPKNSLALSLNSLATFDLLKSYNKLKEVMTYLNVVLPWEIDELLGLVNERGKVTLNYVSIEEIIGSCLAESDNKVEEGNNSQNQIDNRRINEFNDNWVVNEMLNSPAINDSLMQKKPEPIKSGIQDNLNGAGLGDNQMDLNYTVSYNSPNTNNMTISALLAAADDQLTKEVERSSDAIFNSNDATLPVLASDAEALAQFSHAVASPAVPNPIHPISTKPLSQSRKHYLQSEHNPSVKRKLAFTLASRGNSPPFNDALPPAATPSRGFTSPIPGALPKDLYSGISYKSSSFSNLASYGKLLNQKELIKALSKVIEGANAAGLRFSSSTIHELRLNLKELQTQSEINKAKNFPT